MKVKLNIILTAIIALSLLALSYFVSKNIVLKEQLDASKNNELAYISENDSLKNKSIEFKYTIDELKCSEDSLVKEMMKVKKELKVKDKEIAYLSYLASQAHIIDTLSFTDTIFVKNTKIDTTVHNKWYQIGLAISYPNRIGIDIKVPSEKYIIASSNKVLLNPAKCWLKNIFRKKSTIVEVDVVEKNPFIISEKNKFIEIVK